MSKTDYFENEVLKLSTGQTLAMSVPITPYVILFTAAPSDAGGGTEVTGGSYARVNASGKFGTPASGQVQNNVAIAFPDATAAWGTVTHFGIITASSGGTLLRWGALQTARPVANGDPVSFGIGQLILNED